MTGSDCPVKKTIYIIPVGYYIFGWFYSCDSKTKLAHSQVGKPFLSMTFGSSSYWL